MPTQDGFQIDLVRDDAGFHTLEPEWRGLYARSEPRNPFLSYDWVAACRTYVCPNEALFILTARVGGELAGVAPLRVGREWGFRVLRFIGDRWSDYQGFLHAPEVPGVERALLQGLDEARRHWDIAFLRQLADLYTGLNGAALPDSLRGRGVEVTAAPYLEMEGDWKTFLSTGPTSVRRGQRAARKFDREGGSIERLTGAESADLVDAAADIEARSWKPQKGITRFSPGPRRELLRRALATLAPRGEMELWLARKDEKPVAFLLNFLTEGQVWYYQGAYDEAYRKLYPGGALHFRCIERAFHDGVRVYDFLSGDEPYKRTWTTAAHPVKYRAVFPNSVRGYMAFGALVAPRWFLLDFAPASAAHQLWGQLSGGVAQTPEAPTMSAER